MLFLVPVAVVPLLVALALILGGLPDMLRGRLHAERVFVRLAFSWHSIGPVAVFLIATPGAPSWGDWPIYVLALGAQFALDLASSMGARVARCRRFRRPCSRRSCSGSSSSTSCSLQSGFSPLMAAVDQPARLPAGARAGRTAGNDRDRPARPDRRDDRPHRRVRERETVARVDALTGLANRLAWEEYVNVLATAQNEDGGPSRSSSSTSTGSSSRTTRAAMHSATR